MATSIVEIENLSHSFNHQKVLDNISLNIGRGSIYGFLGPNGAGKTTTLRLVLGLLKNQSGNISLFGTELFSNRIALLRQIGSLIEQPSLYAHLSGIENLEIFRLPYQADRKRISEVLHITGLEAAAKKKIRSYSLGMKQRLGIAVALLHDPELLILDEPTNGLDPEGIIEMRAMINSLKKVFGKTILISSHLLSEVEKIITDVAIIDHGKILFQGSFSELQQKKSSQSTVEIEVDNTIAAVDLLKPHYTLSQKNERMIVNSASKQETAKIIALLVNAGVEVYSVTEQNNNLESLFIQIISQ